MADIFHPGQRWISESEPELGLGSVRRVTPRTVTLAFGASDETREYARDNAPLRRVRFRAGDTIKTHEEATVIVLSVAERGGLIFYRGDGRTLCETELSDAISFNKPEQRLFAGQIDPTEVFNLRLAALEHQHRRRKSRVRGFVGGRIELIPHQLYIASEVAARLAPRVLLADEVGLGKTIEACLILHRLILTGRAQRVLILVPESLVHQWFVELLRRFNLWFHIFDKERCEAIETADPEANPFLDDQLVLASISLFTGNETRAQQALAAGWDMLVVDEAHHLGWAAQSAEKSAKDGNSKFGVPASDGLDAGPPEGRTPNRSEAVSREYTVVEALSRQTPGLLLLTATPEQFGMASHFARLRLLDPDRFYDLNGFIKEAENYRDVARLADKLLDNHPLTASDVTMLARILAETEATVRSRLEKIGDRLVRAELLDALLDQHGTGRVMFRNTRATIAGFPKRIARLCPLAVPNGDTDLFEALAKEFGADTEVETAAKSYSNEFLETHRTRPASPEPSEVRPSSGAATSGHERAMEKSPTAGHCCLAAPEDGRTPVPEFNARNFALGKSLPATNERGEEQAQGTCQQTGSSSPRPAPPSDGGAGGNRRPFGRFASSAETLDFSKDPRMNWLADLLRSRDEEKVLLICRTQSKVTAIDAALRQRLNVKQAVFHEGLSLVQRDRNAAWFAEEDGARILLCSEIGSEGRNFQFAHHLVLFDLPLDPELLEQRIGRLDRIGQVSEIQVHVPFVAGSSQEVLARWYHEGLNSFEKNLHGGRELLEQFGARVHDLAQDFHETEETSRAELARLIAETQTARKNVAAQLEAGRDRLLELNSFRPDAGAKLAQEIRRPDADQALDEFMIAVFDHYSIHVEELTHRTYQLGSAGVFAESFPGLPAAGLTVTCDRQRALAREDVQFLTWDHPLVTGALDLLLGSEKGNSSFAKWPDARTADLYVETICLLECIAPPHLHVDRFLPPTPIRVLVDHRGNDVGASIPPAMLAGRLKNGDPYALLEQPALREDLLPGLIAKAEAIAGRQVPGIVAQARKEMTGQLEHEIARLKDLQKVNRSVRAEEVDLLIQQRSALDRRLGDARLRLDSIRLIQRGPD